jgi:hypothetical protein
VIPATAAVVAEAQPHVEERGDEGDEQDARDDDDDATEDAGARALAALARPRCSAACAYRRVRRRLRVERRRRAGA